MSADIYDLVIVGAGSGGLTAAGFAAELRAKTALIERDRIGGDCTWTGCVPSKALLKAASVARQVRESSRYGVRSGTCEVDMARVRDYVRSAIHTVYEHETPERLAESGIDVVAGDARFLDAETVQVGDRTLRAKHFLVVTGARAHRPAIAGLDQVPYLTYERIFDNDQLPDRLVMVGGGPLGLEIAQAYGRLGSRVTVLAPTLLPRDEPEAGEALGRSMAAEGVTFVTARAAKVQQDGKDVIVEAAESRIACDMLVVATGRRPNVKGLDLENAGVHYSEAGIPVDDRLRTNVGHIYAAGDVVGGPQFTHLAAWQAFQAVRNALLPGSASGSTHRVPWVTFTDPEVAHVGMTEQAARHEYGDRIVIHLRPMTEVDRAIADGTTAGFVKVVTDRKNVILGATIVSSRAGELISEFTLALANKLSLRDLAGVIHPYPTYSTAIHQVAADATVRHMLGGTSGKVILGLSRLLR